MKTKKTSSREHEKEYYPSDRKFPDKEPKRPIKNWTKVYSDYEPYADDIEAFHVK